ncbi:MAG: hypothetical protein M0013_08425 [Actinomycetota bacterium]|jgi:hypothetical protein|nr:hypothetical protein [Actinomycetota bacterium]
MAQQTHRSGRSSTLDPTRPTGSAHGHHEATTEDLGDDVRALAVVARSAGRASVVRQVDGILVRVTVEAA